MKIKEVCIQTNLTKKAIEYYIEKKLIEPGILENGYREFTNEDIDKLLKIALYRKTGLSISEIKLVLNNQSSLMTIINKKTLELNRGKEQIKILQKLQTGKSIENVKDDIYNLDRKMTIIEKLLEMFPGYYGKFIGIHFSKYLNESIVNDEQKQAFQEIIIFLDNAPKLKIPIDLQNYIDEYTMLYQNRDIEKMILEKENNIKNYDKFLENNKEFLEYYLEYKKSDEYQNSSPAKLLQLMKEFCQISGYYDIFIPAMRKLSRQYDQYYHHLLKANDYLLKQYPEIENKET